MTAKEILKQRIEDYLKGKGINTNAPFRCLSGKHPDKKPSMSLDRVNLRVKCFSCGVSYDLIDLIKLDYGITDYKEALKKGCEMFGIPYHPTGLTASMPPKQENKKEASTLEVKDFTGYYNQCNNDAHLTTYFKERGISEATVKKFNLGYDKAFKAGGNEWQAIIIPTSKSSYVARNIAKNASDRYRKRGTAQIFNLEVVKQGGPIFIVEGEIDALSVIEGGYNAIGLGSVNNTQKFYDFLKTSASAVQASFIISLDNDDAGNKASEELITKLKELGFKAIKGNISDTYKDANEALIKEPDVFKEMLTLTIQDLDKEAIERLEQRKAEYQKKYTSNYMLDFMNGIQERANTPYISTGFSNLDDILDGGLYEGLYFIGAISSLGKTTFTLQMADQIAKSGQDVIIVSLEMARAELMAKSISRETIIQNNGKTDLAKTTRGITTYSRYLYYSDEERELINKSIKSYTDYAKNIVIIEGQGDIDVKRVDSFVKEHIELTGRKPVLIIDYLQILAPLSERLTDKQNTDKAVTALKRISRDYKIPVFAISSLNRLNYNSKISMEAFKESGAIEYSSDILMGLQFKSVGNDNFDATEAKRASNNIDTPRELELVILKNRNGRTGDHISFEYYPAFNYFIEKGW